MDQRLTFDEDLENYEKWRTDYCDDLFAEIIRYSGIGAGKSAVDVGCGTGKSTAPILETGCCVTGVEYGENLAAYVREKFHHCDSFSVENTKFEDFQCKSGSFDLVFSGSAFHWIPEEIGYSKAYDILKRGGTLALFWSFPAPDIERPGLLEDMNGIYDRYDPNNRLKPNEKSYGQRTPILETIGKYGFAEIEYYLYKKKKTYNAVDYISVLNTFATHLMIEPVSRRNQYENEIIEAINNAGGYIDVYDVMDLFLAKKPF